MAQQDETLSQLKKALGAIKELRTRLDMVERARTEPIAIIGIGCRFPGGANSPEAYWELLANGVDAISETPKDRWDVDEFYDPDPNMQGKISSRWGGYLHDIDQFDPYFFGISPKEAAYMDPQQRLLLEVAWEALEDAGQVREKLTGSLTGVFVGVHSHSSDYYLMQVQDVDAIDTYSGTGTSHSVVGGRLSYLFDWRGPNVSLDTACSSSLVAVHLAVQSLRSRECNLALAGGVNIMLSPEFTVAASRMHMLSADGRCKAFDQRADGFTRGEGCGVVVLKRLSDAQADGDPILAVIRGSAVNQDGKSNGLTAPNSLSQADVIRAALSNGGVNPSEISYIEAHGTGTALGDPIEVEALAMVLGGAQDERQRCYLGSAKTNIGHLEGAAGIAGLIKVVLSIQHRAIAPLVHFTGLNPYISFENTPFAITTELRPWAVESGRRLAGLSSFGWSGTNAHLVIEEAPQAEAVKRANSPEPEVTVLPLSAHTPDSLKELARRYSEFLKSNQTQKIALRDMGYSAGQRRTHHDYRAAFIGYSHDEIADLMTAYVGGNAQPNIASGRRDPNQAAQVVFVFPGQGGQWIGMARGLLAMEPVFREAIEACERAFKSLVSWSLTEILARSQDVAQFEEIDVIQPTLFAIQVALAALWRSWGVEPDAILGHSLGEVAGAYVAGALSLEDAAKVICHRSGLMKTTSGQGAMAVVGLTYDQTAELIGSYESRVSIAVSNSPRSTVISGEPAAVEEILIALKVKDIFARAVKVDVASHSPQMEPLKSELVRVLSELKPNPGSVPIYSTVDGKVINGSTLTPDYWGRNLRQQVLFSSMVTQALDDGFNVFIELSPHPVLLSSIEDTMHHLGKQGITIPSMLREKDEVLTIRSSLGALYAAGCEVDWSLMYPQGGRVVKLPAYPWQRSRFWIENPIASGKLKFKGGHPLLGQRLPTLAHLPGSSFWENRLDKRFWQYVAKVRSYQEGQNQNSKDTDLSAVIYSEIGLLVARELFGDKGHRITTLEVVEALSLDGPETRGLQTILSDEGDETASFQIFFRDDERASWQACARGRIQLDLVQTDWLYEMDWQSPMPLVPSIMDKHSESGHWLILADQGGLGTKLAAQLSQAGASTTLVFAESQYALREDGSYAIHPQRPEDFKRLLDNMGKACRGVVYLWGLDLPETNDLLPRHMADVQVLAGEGALFLTQSLAYREWSKSTHLWLVTKGAQSVKRELYPTMMQGVAQAPLWGLGRVIALEMPDLWGGLIDLGTGSDVSQDAEELFEEIWQIGNEDQIAYVDGQRYVARLKQTPYQANTVAFEWHSEATYLITGGLRGVGLLFAQWLVEQGVRHLVLMGRSGASDAAQSTLAELEAIGVQVLVAKADVSNKDDLQQVLNDVRQKMPPLRGIIHSAAALDDAGLLQQDGEKFNKAMAAKVSGTWNLHTLTKDIPLDCFVVFSSFASVLGSAGQANYAAANAFMDTLIHYRRTQGLSGLSINWGAWGEVGLAAGMGDYFAKIGLQMMSPKAAAATMPCLLGAGAAQVVVAAVDWGKFGPDYATKRGRMLLETIQGGTNAAIVSPEKWADFAGRLEQTAPAERYALILSEVRAEVADVLGFTPAEALDIRRGFFKMGMDSLMSVQLRNRLENRLNCFLPPTVALEYPSVEGLAGYIAQDVFKLASVSATEVLVKDTGASLEGLSDDDLLALLDDELAAIDKLTGDE